MAFPRSSSRLIWALFVLACSLQVTTMAQQLNSGFEIANQWRPGRAWKVEYQIAVPPEEMHPNAAPPAPERSLWNYEVIEGTGDGLVLIRMSEEKGSRVYELAFDRVGPTLRQVVRISGTFRDTVIDNPLKDAFTGWSLRYPGIFDWPFLAVTPGGNHEFHAGPFLVKQTAKVADGVLETSMSYTDRKSDEFIENRRVTQTWSAGSPWWLTGTIESEFLVDGQKSKQVLIQGRLIEP